MVWLMNVEITCARISVLCPQRVHIGADLATHQHDERQGQDNRVSGQPIHNFADYIIHDLEQTTRCDTFAKGDATHSEENHSPEELIKIVLEEVRSV